MKPLNVQYRLTRPIMLDVQFEVRGFTALLGRSGAGKTSLLKALAGLLSAEGTPWDGVPPERRAVGYVPQGLSLFPHLSVLENAAFGLAGPDRHRVAEQWLGDLGIGHLAGRRASEVSGGEAQRVALARALAPGPELLLLDEPSAALDAATRDAVLNQLIETIAGTGRPALAATHDFAVAALADWVVLLAGGRIIQQGTPLEVFEHPACADAARLAGYQNVWSEGGQIFAIRAEHIQLAATGRSAIIAGARPLYGGLRLTMAGAPGFVVILPEGGQAGAETGQTVHLHFPDEKLKKLGK